MTLPLRYALNILPLLLSNFCLSPARLSHARLVLSLRQRRLLAYMYEMVLFCINLERYLTVHSDKTGGASLCKRHSATIVNNRHVSFCAEFVVLQ